MKSIPLMFFSNKEVLKSTKFHIIAIIIIFLINISLISTPNFFGRINSVDIITELSDIEEAFEMIYENELDCVVEEKMMNCNIEEDLNYSGYDILYTESFEDITLTNSTIYFTKEAVAIYYIEDEQIYTLVGNYSLLDGLDFKQVKTMDTDVSREEHYDLATDDILSAVYYSTLDENLVMIYMAQFVQVTLYTVVVASLFMLMNYRAKIKRLSYINSYKIIISSMTGPALLAAIISLFNAGFASMIFFIIYAIRAMFVYFKILGSEQTYLD